MYEEVKRVWLEEPGCGHTWSIQAIGDETAYAALKKFFFLFNSQYKLFLQGDQEKENWVMIELLGEDPNSEKILDIWVKAKDFVISHAPGVKRINSFELLY